MEPTGNPYRPPAADSGAKAVVRKGRWRRVLVLSLPFYLLSVTAAMAVLALPPRLLREFPPNPPGWMLGAFIAAWLLLAWVGGHFCRRCWRRARRLSR